MHSLSDSNAPLSDQNQYVSTRNGINKATDDVNMIFHKEAIKAGLMKQKRKPVKRQNPDKWFDQECKTIRKELRKITNEKHCQANNPALRIRHNEMLKKYKCTVRIKKMNYTHMKLEDIENDNQINCGICGTSSTQSNIHYSSKMVTSGEHILKICIKTYQ